MKKIAYIELDTHAEIAQNFMDLMNDSKDFAVDYYFSGMIANQINEKPLNTYLTSHSTILKMLENKKYDLIIIGTVHRYFNVFMKISNDFNTSIIVHNLNFSSISKWNLIRNVFRNDFIYRFKLLLKEDLLCAPMVYQNGKNLLVLDQGIADFDLSLSYSNTTFLKFLPVFHNEFKKENASEIFTIVIPGTVSQQRRDYLQVFKTLKTFSNNRKYQVVFLGKALEQELVWLKKFDTLKPENISITYFTEKVSSLIFNDWMQKADVLWCPIQKETEFFSQKEFYGQTKMSGNIGDAIKYGKPAVFPSFYTTSFSFIYPEESNVEKQFELIISQEEHDFSAFNKEKVLRELERSLGRLI